ncbi:MAG: DUF5994 family protein [Nocardioides sp.]
MATSSNDVPANATTTGEGLRLQLSDPAPHSRVDGAWWPRSRDLQREAAELVDHFPAESGRISRLVFSRPDWDDSSHDGHGVRTIRAARGQMKVGSFPSDDTHLMILAMSSGQRLKLLVIPSDTPDAEGERRLRAVAEPDAMMRDGAVDWDRWDDESPST